MSTIPLNDDLIRLLAATDALWWPCRSPDQRAHGVRHERRREYRRYGLPIRTAHSGDAAARKSQERWLARLEQTGVIQVGRQRGKRTHWRLSDNADWAFRSLAGQYGFWQMVACMMCLDAHERRCRVVPADKPVNRHAEYQLVGCEPRDEPSAETNRRCGDLAEMLLPALVRGWVTSASDMRGTTAYSLTTAGVAVVRNPEAYDPDRTDWPDYDPAHDATYDEAFASTLDELERGKATPGHVFIFLSAGCWDWFEAPELRPFTVFRRDGQQRSITSIERAYKRLVGVQS